MTVFGVSMVKDEADVIEGTLRHLAAEVDELIVADNGSTDGTRDLLAKLADDLPLTVLDDDEPGYWQSAKVTRLANLAAEHGATWVVPFDADELWVGGDRLSVVLADCPAMVATANLFNHFPSAMDPPGDDPFATIVWRQRRQAPLPKVAFRWADGVVVEQGNHGVSYPDGVPSVMPLLEVRHFPYRSVEQFVRKVRNGAAAYAATDMPEHVGAHWRGYGRILDERGEDGLREVFETYFWHLSPPDAGLVRDPAPYRRWEVTT